MVVSPDGRDSSATIHQDAIVRRLRLTPGAKKTYVVADGRALWLQVINGDMQIDGAQLHAGDGANTETSGPHQITANSTSEALIFDLG